MALWLVVGGGDKGGVVVREGHEVSSPLCAERLSTGAVVEQVELLEAENRLHFRQLSAGRLGARGTPRQGWVSVKLTSGKDLLRKLDGPVWEVVGGGGSSGGSGLVVRELQELRSGELGRLATESLVEEVELVKERLRYRLLQGSGPSSGWVTVQLQQKPLLRRVVSATAPALRSFLAALRELSDQGMAKAVEEVAKFGVEEWREAVNHIETSLWEHADFRLKRKALRYMSRCPTTVSLSSLLRAGLRDGDATVRCDAARAAAVSVAAAEVYEELMERLASDCSWRVRLWCVRALESRRAPRAAELAALLEKEVDPDVRAELARLAGEEARPAAAAAEAAPVPAAVRVVAVPAVGAALSVAALHGAASNSNVMKFQVRMLSQALSSQLGGTAVTWSFLDADAPPWSPVPGATDPIFGDVSEVQKKLAKGEPLRSWYSHGNLCYNGVDEGVAHLLSRLEGLRPQVLVTFSQASNLISMLLDHLRRTKAAAPWQLTVMFSGGHIDDPIFQWPQGWTSKQPTVRVFNAAKDAFFEEGEGSLQQMYPEILELPHTDGHVFPVSPPRAPEIYRRIAEEIGRRCVEANKMAAPW